MEDNKKFDATEEIVFLDSEIIEDDADAPYGVIVEIPEENEKKTASGVNDVPAPEPVIEEIEEAPFAETVVAPKAEAPEEKTFEEAFFETAPDAGKTQAQDELPKPVEEDAAADALPAYAEEPVSETIEQSETAPSADVWKVADIGAEKKPAKTPKKTKEVSEMKASEEKPAAKKATAVQATAKKETVKKPVEKAPAKTEAAKPAAKASAPAEAAKKTPAKAAAAKPAEKEVKKAAKPAVEAETVLIAGDDSAPHGKFIIKKTEKGNFVYKLYSFNHRVVAIGAEQYGSLATCKTGINSVIKNAATAPIEDQTLKKWEEQKCPKWQIYADKKGEIRLRLIASNGNIVATTNDGYLSKDAAKNGIEAIGRACKGADVVRNDTLW